MKENAGSPIKEYIYRVLRVVLVVFALCIIIFAETKAIVPPFED